MTTNTGVVSADYAPPAAGPRPVGEVVRRARLGVTLTFLLPGLLFGAWVPRLPDIKDDLELSAGALGLALLTPAVGALLVMAPIGRLCARIGSGPIARVAIALFAVFTATTPMASSGPLLALFLLPWGAAVGASDVAMNAQAVTVERAYGRPVMSGFHAWFSVGGLTGAGIGSACAAIGIGVVPQQIAMAMLGAGVGLWVSRYYLPDRQQRTEISGAAPGTAGDTGSGSSGHRTARSALVLLGIASIAALVTEGAVTDWSAILLREDLHASAGVAGIGFTAFSATMALGRFCGDRVIHRYGAGRTAGTLGLIGSLGLTAGFAIGTAASTIVGFAVVGLGIAVMFPVLITTAAAAAEHPGSGIAAVTTTGYTAFLAGPPLIGQLADQIGLPSALWLLPGLVALAAVLILKATSIAAVPAPATTPQAQAQA